MTIDSTTAIQYSGYLHREVRRLLKSRRVAEGSEEARIQRILEEERKRVQEVYGLKRKVIEKSEPRGYDTQKKFEEMIELVKQYPVKPAIRLPPSKPYEVSET